MLIERLNYVHMSLGKFPTVGILAFLVQSCMSRDTMVVRPSEPNGRYDV